MPSVSIAFGLFLTLVGLIAFSVTYQVGVKPPYTALIPCIFGVLLMVLGRLALKDSLRKHAMHGAAMVALIGLLGSAGMGVPKLIKLLGGDETVLVRAVTAQLVMAATCALFLFLCVRSFIAARKARELTAASVPAPTEGEKLPG